MTRLPASSEIATRIAARIAEFPARHPEKLEWLVPQVARHGALPLYVGWIETFGIRPDGELVRWSNDGEFEGTLPIEEPSWALLALVRGASRYPELRPLLPVRGPDAPDCRCRAIPMCASGEVGCAECGGLGWLPDAGWLASLCGGPRPRRRLAWYHRWFGRRGRGSGS
jgi:hypothetical protein